MGFLSRLFGRKGAEPTPATEVAERSCPHTAIVPRWDNAADIGKNALVTAYSCESCGALFTREEGERLLNEVAERLRISEVDRLKRQ
jgi:hypothetical protein